MPQTQRQESSELRLSNNHRDEKRGWAATRKGNAHATTGGKRRRVRQLSTISREFSSTCTQLAGNSLVSWPFLVRTKGAWHVRVE